MPIPLAIDPRQLAAEIEATVSEFNRLAVLATTMRIEVRAEIQTFELGGYPARPKLAVQVIAPL
jgi:hypothetical protein